MPEVVQLISWQPQELLNPAQIRSHSLSVVVSTLQLSWQVVQDLYSLVCLKLAVSCGLRDPVSQSATAVASSDVVGARHNTRLNTSETKLLQKSAPGAGSAGDVTANHSPLPGPLAVCSNASPGVDLNSLLRQMAPLAVLVNGAAKPSLSNR